MTNAMMTMPFPAGRYFQLREAYPTERACDVLRHLRAEKVRREKWWNVHWSEACETSAEFSDVRPYYQLWECTIWVAIPNDSPYATHPQEEVIISCGCVDLGRYGHPDSTFHARMIEADLILEAAQWYQEEQQEAA